MEARRDFAFFLICSCSMDEISPDKETDLKHWTENKIHATKSSVHPNII
jgi:hypothetical protein